MTLDEAKQIQHDAYVALADIRTERKDKFIARKKVELEPLKEQLDALERKIDNEVRDEYIDRIEAAEAKSKEAQALVDELTLQNNKNEWLPEGTIVEQWETGRWSNTTKLKRKGVVALYNHQELKLPTYGGLNVGDIIVIHLKKDGTHGKLFDRIQKQWNDEGFYTKGWQLEKK